MNRAVLAVGALLAVPLIAFLALGLGNDPNQIDSPLVGKPAPDFALQDLNGRTWSLAELRGRPVVINFWATWCQPCVYEHPILVDSARRWQGRAAFLGVILHDTPEAVDAMVRQRGAWGPALVDPESRVALAYGVYGAPETFFVDAAGTIVEKVTGPVTPDQLEALLQRLETTAADASVGAAS